MSSINIITEPSIYVVGRQSVDRDEMTRFLCDVGAPDYTTDAPSAGEELIECSGRLCYSSHSNPRPGGNLIYLKHILESAHGSVCEHAVFNFIFTGVSRSLTHELVRHRAGFSYSMLSQRFVDESDVAFVVPPAIRASDKITYDAWLEQVAHARNRYCWLSDSLSSQFAHIEDKTARRKAAREAARSVLPNCTETRIFATANCRAIRNFCEQRASLGADAEIRRLALTLLAVMKREAANLFADFQFTPARDGTLYATCDYRKV